MNPEEKFLETLKTLGFPRVNKYSAANFEPYFADSELRPFLEYFCTLDENNVLTSEELEEFDSITPQEMKVLEELASNTENFTTEEEVLKDEEAEFLTERLSFLERKHNSLEEQKRTLLEHKDVILKEKVDCEAANKNLRRLFDDFSMNKVPQGIDKLSVTLKTISELISKLKAVSDVKDDENMMLPFLHLRDVEEYFLEEEKLDSLVMTNLLRDLQFEDEAKTKLSIPGLSTQELTKEILILKKSLKMSKICESKSVCNSIKSEKTALLVKKFQDGYFDCILEMSVAQLSYKFAEATKLNECLTKKEALLLSNLSNVISEHVDAQCRQIAIAHCNEIRLMYKNSLDKISHPLKYLLNQKARLELLNLLISIHQKHWQDTKDLIDQVFLFANSEKETCRLRQQKMEESMKRAEVEETYLKPDSIFFSAHKVLSDEVGNQEQSLITLSDVIKCVEKLFERKEFISKIAEENNEVIRILEEQYSELEKVISRGADFDEFMKMENNFSTKVNQVEILLQEISSILKESENEWQQKNKLLESNRNLQLARNLFIYALLERETFERIIENIEEAAPHLA